MAKTDKNFTDKLPSMAAADQQQPETAAQEAPPAQSAPEGSEAFGKAVERLSAGVSQSLKMSGTTGEGIMQEIERVGALDAKAVQKIFVNAPQRTFITLDNRMVYELHQGINEVERFIGEHWFAKARGVEVVRDAAAKG